MAQPFDASAAPFNRLSPEEVAIVRNALDIGYYRPGETIIARKLEAISRDEEATRFAPLMDARVADLSPRAAAFIDATDTIQQAGAKMRELNCYALFVRNGERTGVLTRSDLVTAAIVNRQPIDGPVGPLANHVVVCVAPDDFVSTALLRMTKHNKRRVAVVESGEFVGVGFH